MTPPTKPVSRKAHGSLTLPSYVLHHSFTRLTAANRYDPADLLAAPVDYDDHYMPDEVTRDHARRMHYAAHRIHRARTPAELRHWFRSYLTLRDRIVLGNRKLIYRAVRRRMAVANRADDLIGDCHIVLIQAVAAFNPWLGIRFSTYAYTCLVRALARLSHRLTTDWVARALSLEILPDGEPSGRFNPDPASNGSFRIDDYFRDDHPLLTNREKVILTRRFGFREPTGHPTLERVGAEMGLSKERVRQVQATAIDKLRRALLEPDATR